jgi:PAS domain S-box-containing protein
MKTSHALQTPQKGWLPIILIAVLTIAIFIVSIISLLSGWQTIFQNLFYFPIILACVFYVKRGFVFSVLLAFCYFVLMAIFSNDPVVLEGALIRVLIFILVAGVITYLSMIRIRAEEAALQTRSNFEVFFNTIDDFLYVLDEQGNILHTNETVIRRLGYTKSEIPSQPVLKMPPPERQESAGHNGQEQQTGTRDLYPPMPLLTKDGRLIPVETRVTRGEWDGKPVLFVVRKDISPLKLSEEKFSTAFRSNASLMALLTKADGKFIEVNQAFLKTLGFSLDEVIGKTALDLDIFVHPGTLDDAISQLEKQGRVRNLEVQVRIKNGTIRTGLFSLDNIMIGLEHCLLTVFNDITGLKQSEMALRESEERFRLLLQNIPSVSVQGYSMDGTTQYWNEASGKLYGYTADEAIGKNLVDLIIPPEMREDVRQACRVMAQTGQPIPASELSLMRKDGSRVAVYSSHALVKKSGGGMELFCIDIDLTDRKLAEDTLQRVNQKLNVLSQLTRKDLTSQTFVLSSYLELTKKQLTGQDQIIETLQKGVQEIQSINKTIEYTKDYQDMGATPPKWQNVKMALLLGLSHISIGKIQHRLETEQLEIFADPLLEKVCQRLFENSVKHGDHVTLIRVWHTATPDGATIFFEDDGIGIPQEKKEQIFLRNEGFTASRGSLIFVREILSITGITIKETGEPGKGARFEMTVPKGAWRIAGEST